jgi:ribosomal-protein-alanine N-acetyltransferase
MRADGKKVYVRLLGPEDERALVDLRRRNEDFLRPWEPARPKGFFEPKGQRLVLQRAAVDAEDDRAYSFGIFTLDDHLVGTINLSNVVRGIWQNATLGYFVDETANGRGFATEAIALVVRLAFTEMELHRIQAAVMPRNPGSRRALEKAGFRFEGESPRYLKIAETWEDHLIFAITAEDVAS